MNFLKRIIAMAAPEPAPIIGAATVEAEEPASGVTVATPDREAITRIAEILTCEEAQGRQTLAQHLALRTDLTVANAKTALSAASREGAAVVPSDTDKPDARALVQAQHNRFFSEHRAQYPELWNEQPAASDAETVSRIIHNYAAVAGLKVVSR